MRLIIGLGNPGKQYENTRHNAGFILLDEIQKAFSFPEFKFDGKFNAEISEGKSDVKGQMSKVILAKPQSFMNLSGTVVKALMDFYKIPLENISVIHDDLDINLGEYKISTDSSAAGHNGVQNIIDELGTQKFTRIRVGIEGADKKKDRIIPGDVFVLQPFSEEELEAIKKLAAEITNIL
jgi:PTH1 family peptidyl-tRNA hydrolase